MEHLDTDGDELDYKQNEDGFREFLHDLADALFPFPGYREYQDEIVYEVLEAFFINDADNVVVEGPTGIGKSPANVCIARVFNSLVRNSGKIESYFDTRIGITDGDTFYTTPQKSLREQLAEDETLQQYVHQLMARADYTCGVSGQSCAECPVRSSTEESCLTQSNCTYWSEKSQGFRENILAVTFAMLITDNYLPVMDESGRQISYRDRGLVIVDEGHNSEGQSASMFAGFTVSPWAIPDDVFGDAGRRADWDDNRFRDVEPILRGVLGRCERFIDRHEGDERYQLAVDNCQNMKRKIEYAFRTHEAGKAWVVNVNEVSEPRGRGTTKNIQVKPVRVDDFLEEYVWSRGEKRLITSATIPFRGNIDAWAERLGLPGETTFVSKPTPFPRQHRLIYTNTIVGQMNSSNEDENWDDAIAAVEQIHKHHRGENILIHSVSYPRAEKIGESLDGAIIDDDDLEGGAVLDRWYNSDTDILISPRMTEGVDLHDERCRAQILWKAPFAYYGDSRVSYLLNEEGDWDWYYQKALTDIVQAVGRAVRGPEPEEAASFYVLDSKFHDVMERTRPPEYILDAITDAKPGHWYQSQAAPWR